VESVWKRFGDRAVLKGLGCEIPDGGITTILGGSGSGKTTLLRIIAGLEQADSGRILFDEHDVTSQVPQDRRVGFVFQDFALYWHLSVARNLAMPLLVERLSREETRTRVVEMARELGLSEYLDRPAATLSGGEAQRLAVGRALIRRPHLVLLDEPFSNLDATLRREARDFVFEELRRWNATAVLVTHDHHDAQAAGGLVHFIGRGRVLQSGRWEELYTAPAVGEIAQTVSFLAPLVVRGTVRAAGDTWALINDNLNIRVNLSKVSNETLVACGQVYYRPEDLRIVEETRQGAGIVRGRLERYLYDGSNRYVEITHSSGLRLKAMCESDDKSIGAVVGVDLQAARQLLFEECSS
jgi:sulfate transport system ATP-binding protein